MEVKKLGVIVGVVGLLVLSACAPTVTGDPFGEADLAGVLPGSGTYQPPRGVYEAVPYVDEARLTHPDPRVREEAFAALRRQRVAGDAGPEFHYLYGRYYEASGDYRTAASYYNRGLRALYPFAFDRQRRDVWEYGYRRAEAYLRFDPGKAVRDARILAEKAAPVERGRLSQKSRAYALLVRAEEAVGNPSGVLEAADLFYKSLADVAWGGAVADLFWGVTLSRAKALEALGRVEEARKVYGEIVSTRDLFVPREVQAEAEKALSRLGGPVSQAPEPPRDRGEPAPGTPPPPQPSSSTSASSFQEQAVGTVKAFLEALKALDFAGVNRVLSQPLYDTLKERELARRVTPEMREKAGKFRYEIARVTPPSPTAPLPRVEVVYDLGEGEKLLVLYLVSVQDRELVVLSGALPPALTAFLGSVDTEAVTRFLKEFHAFVGLPL